MANQYWFKPKTFGYGARPTTWEGWAIVTAYCVVVTIVTLGVLILAEPGKASAAAQWTMWLAWLIVIGIATAVLTVVSKRRTDGEWRWGRKADVSLRERFKA